MASGKSRSKNRSAAAQASKQAAAAAAPATATAGEISVPEDDTAWHEEYHYVFKDMRHLIIVSVSLFVIIIILGFFL